MRRILVTGTVQHQLEANGVKWNTGGNMGWSGLGILSLPGSSEPPCGTLWGESLLGSPKLGRPATHLSYAMGVGVN